MSKHFRPIKFIGAGPEFGGLMIDAYSASWAPWAALREAIARETDLPEEYINTFEAYWGGEHNDADGAELVTIDGALAGAINRALTPIEFELLLTLPGFGRATDAWPYPTTAPAPAPQSEMSSVCIFWRSYRDYYHTEPHSILRSKIVRR